MKITTADGTVYKTRKNGRSKIIIGDEIVKVEYETN